MTDHGFLWVCLGAAFGAPARYLVDRFVQSRLDAVMPWGTLSVNVAGSLVLGFVTGLAAHHSVSPEVMTIVAIVDAKEADQVIDPRDQKLETIKQRCLQAAQVKYICVYPPTLPRYRELREQVLGPASELV